MTTRTTDVFQVEHIEYVTDRQAALASAAAFSVGAALPLLMALGTPNSLVVEAVSIASLLFLALLGVVGAKTGGANRPERCPRIHPASDSPRGSGPARC